ncbi:SMI1/KNR4 family protein [Embleya sp. NPDC020886]|uniref:SMI1/KNR4 family protein n=1 Tax=Embleya sp. NPDC020886 TaxID=3363980 RepID=UPI00378ACAB5
MLAMYREFHCLSAGRHDERAFVNATTRELDADLERAREWALAGDWERAEAEFARIGEYGRPGARVLGDQLRRFQGYTYLVEFGIIAFDPVYASEFRPALADTRVRNGHGDSLGFTRVGWTSDEAMAAADEVLWQVRESTFRHTAPGAFGRVVDAAREQARWGATDRAWRMLRAGFGLWESLGTDHIAPVGLFADPVLGPLITPERGRLLPAVPRGGQRGGAAARGAEPGPEDESVLDPDDLTWLAEPDHNGTCQAYRFILVQGAEPAELASLIGADEQAEPSPPRTRREAERAAWTGTSSSYDDKALVAIGRAGPDWAFAFDARPRPFHEGRFVSPVGAAPQAGRAVVVWCAPDRPGSPGGLFHLSVAEGGAECHVFTVQGATVRRSGDIPPALDPDRLFPPRAGELFSASGHRRALAAVTAEFGVALPRFALTRGRLHTLTTASWTRPPGPGEGYLTTTVTLR